MEVDLEIANQQRQIEVLSRSVDYVIKRLQEVGKGERPHSETRSRERKQFEPTQQCGGYYHRYQRLTGT